MIILLDTDVLIDVALNRTPHFEPASAVLLECEKRTVQGFVAWHTLSNLYYLVSAAKESEARRFLEELVVFIDVVPTARDDFRYAARLAMRDLEDALQVAAATACGAEVIVTRNVRDYVRSPIRAITPAALLRQIR